MTGAAEAGRAVVVIPARYQSSRFPGKPLVPLRGASGEARTLLQRTHDIARDVPGIASVLVATDDERIASHARDFGADVVMTSPDCLNGTERCAEVAASLPSDVEIVVNLQGDAPLTPPHFLTALLAAMGRLREEGVPAALRVATPVLRCDEETEARFLEDRREGRVGGTTAVTDRHWNALYFSKEVIPFHPAGTVPSPVFHHVGVYAYTPEALSAYRTAEPGLLERLEGLEQLRFLEEGMKVVCVEVEAADNRFWEVNNPVDVPRVERVLAERGIS